MDESLQDLQSRRNFLRAAAAAAACVLPAAAAVRGRGALYVGGTLTAIPEKTSGRLDVTAAGAALFSCKKGSFKIPYRSISSLEYGQKAGRRVGVALAVSPLALLSKKRRHFLSVAFLDEHGLKQGAVFELAKNQTHSVVRSFEQQSGQKAVFESVDAQKHFEKEAR